MRSARIYLLASLLALSAMVGCGTQGGTGGGLVGFDPSSTIPAVVSFTVSPKTVTRNASQTVQFSVTGVFSNGTTGDVTSLATWSSSNPNSVTIGGSTGLATAVLPGTSTITATIGGATDTATFTVPPFVNRLFVSNFLGKSITVYDPAIGADQAPVRNITGSNTTLDAPTQMVVSGQELVVADSGASQAIDTFSLHTNGNVAPLRRIAGASTKISGPRGVAVSNGELFVSNSVDNSITVYPANASGDVAPIRTISGGLTLLNNPREISVSNGEILVANGTGGQVLGFPVAADLNVAPTLRNLTSAAPSLLVGPFGLSLSPTELTVVDVNGAVHTFAANANGATLALRTITGATTLLSSPAAATIFGAEMFVANAGLAPALNINTVLVFPSNQNNANAPTRQLIGPSTLLNEPVSVLVAPST